MISTIWLKDRIINTISFLAYLFWVPFRVLPSKNILQKKDLHFLFWANGGIGDIINLLPILRSLRNQRPLCIITVLICQEQVFTILQREESVNNVILGPTPLVKFIQSIRFFATTIRNIKPDVILQDFLGSSGKIRSTLCNLVSGAVIRVGYNTKLRGFCNTYTLQATPRKHVQDLYFELLEILEFKKEIYSNMVFLTPDELKFAETFYKYNGLKWNDYVIAMHFGYTPMTNFKRVFPIEKALTIIRKLTEKKYKVLLLGSKNEHEVLTYIAKEFKDQVVVATNKDLFQTAALIKNANIMVSADTGIMHLAGAVGATTIGLFGATGEQRARPLTEKGSILYADILCRPCWNDHRLGKETIVQRDCQKPDCLLMIDVDVLIEKIIKSITDKGRDKTIAYN